MVHLKKREGKIQLEKRRNQQLLRVIDIKKIEDTLKLTLACKENEENRFTDTNEPQYVMIPTTNNLDIVGLYELRPKHLQIL